MIHGAIIDTASEVLGKAKKKKRPSVTNNILDLCDMRRSIKKRRKDDPVAIQNYCEVNKEIGRTVKEAKKNWITDRCKEIDSGTGTGNSRAILKL